MFNINDLVKIEDLDKPQFLENVYGTKDAFVATLSVTPQKTQALADALDLTPEEIPLGFFLVTNTSGIDTTRSDMFQHSSAEESLAILDILVKEKNLV